MDRGSSLQHTLHSESTGTMGQQQQTRVARTHLVCDWTTLLSFSGESSWLRLALSGDESELQVEPAPDGELYA